jgi:NAD(P)-dependent dehydrogenase (short-subunit alcohol dehydrogenase family)
MALLDGKIALITGAGSGMARATSRVFVREGAKVFGVDVSGREKETADELGDAFVPFNADVSAHRSSVAPSSRSTGARRPYSPPEPSGRSPR